MVELPLLVPEKKSNEHSSALQFFVFTFSFLHHVCLLYAVLLFTENALVFYLILSDLPEFKFGLLDYKAIALSTQPPLIEKQ